MSPVFSKAVTASRARRAGRVSRDDVKFEWFISEVMQKVRRTLKQRVTIAAQHLQDKVVKNISKPVRKLGVITVRSKHGEFPRADTTLLMKTIFNTIKIIDKDIVDGYVGTTLDYGIILETSKKLNRSFLLRTFREEKDKIKRIMDGPIK